MNTCIYCLQKKENKDFNKEHVVPKAFGSFIDAYTLINKVCSTCNQNFGNKIDCYLARNTGHGIDRYKYGTRNYENFKGIENTSTLFIKASKGLYKGVYFRLLASGNNGFQNVEPLPQVGFLRKDGL